MRWRVVRLIAFALFWGVVIALTLASRDHLPHAQAFVRAASVAPLVAGLMMAVDGCRAERLWSQPVLGLMVAGVAFVQAAFRFGGATVVNVMLGVVFVAAVAAQRDPVESTRRAIAIGLLLALVASVMTFYYIDYPLRRLGGVPASVVVLAVRSLATLTVVAASLAALAAAQRLSARFGADTVNSTAAAIVALTQLAYFYVDVFADPPVRFVHVAIVTVLAVAAAACAKTGTASDSRLGSITAVGLLGIVCLQFAYFYVDYFRGFERHASFTAVGEFRRPPTTINAEHAELADSSKFCELSELCV